MIHNIVLYVTDFFFLKQYNMHKMGENTQKKNKSPCMQAMARFMEKIMGGKATFDPDRIVLTAGATAANELLTFILADPRDALLIPTPYYPG